MATPALDRLFAPGVLASPLTNTNPIQNPLDVAQQEATLQSQAEQRAKLDALKQQLYKAAVLKDQPGGGFAQGQGPLGIRMGQGPMGWMTSVGDAIAGIIQRKKQDKNAEAVTGLQGASSAADQKLVENLIRGAPGGIYGTGYGMDRPSLVSIGSPLSLGRND